MRVFLIILITTFLENQVTCKDCRFSWMWFVSEIVAWKVMRAHFHKQVGKDSCLFLWGVFTITFVKRHLSWIHFGLMFRLISILLSYLSKLNIYWLNALLILQWSAFRQREMEVVSSRNLCFIKFAFTAFFMEEN